MVVGERTRRLVEGLFVFEELGPHIDQGDRASRSRSTGCASRPARPAASRRPRRRGLTPLVGRDEEIRLLLSRWDGAKAGEGQVVLLTGEPGIGKSRIIQSLSRAACAATSRRVLRYFCSPFYVHSALHPVLDQLERAAEL